MSSIFGGSKSKQQSTSQQSSQSQSTSNSLSFNQAYPWAQQTYGGMAQNGANASNALTSLLGIGGNADAQKAAFDNYKNSAGYQFQLQQGMDAINGNAAAKGMLSSGATAKALAGYGQNLASTYYNNYLDRLLGVGNQGLQAGGLVTGAGNVSQSNSQSTSSSTGTSNSTGTSKSKPGIGGFIGQVASGVAASDRRLKTNIVKISAFDNGLNIYQYDYINGEGPYIGVMADEVAEIVPEALGPVIDNYMTVDYSKLKEAVNG